MPEIGQPVTLDIGPALASLDKLAAASEATTQAINLGRATLNQSAADVARQAVAQSDALAKQQAEYRNAVAALQSARDAVRELTTRQNELNAAQKKVKDGTDEYQRIGRLLDQNKAKLNEAKQAVGENVAATRQERAAVQEVADARRQEANQTKLAAAAGRDAERSAKAEALAEKQATAELDKQVRSAGLLAQLTKQLADLTERRARATTKTEALSYNKEIASTKSQIDELTGSLTETSKGGGILSGVLGKVGAAAAGAFTVAKILEVGQEIEEVTAKFEKYRITLTGAFDGDQGRADRALLQVQRFADANGLEIESLTDTYVKLVNRGIIPTTTQLRQLSDIAATSGKSTDQFVEALLDAQTGEFERLKEFGIKVKNNGDTLSFTFRGVKQEVKNTQQAITDYLYALGDAQGVQGQAAAQLQSLGGASAQAKNGLTELFQVIGERAKPAFSGLINLAGSAARALANYFKSSDQVARDESAAGIDQYAEYIGARFKRVAEAAKAAGQDVDAAVKQAAADQTKFVDAKLAKARRDLDNFYRRTTESDTGSEVSTLDKNEEARLQTRIKLFEGQRQAAQRAYKASVDGAAAEAEQVGRIEALRKKIAAETKVRDAAADTAPGNALRVKLNAQIDTDTKLLNELLGKVDKTAKAQADKLAAALRALQQERATLEGLAAKAAEKIAISEADRAKLVFDEALRGVSLLEQKLRDAEAKVQAAGGRGRNADGVIDGAEGTRLTALRVAALDAYYDALGKLERERQQRLFDLQADSAAKEVEQVNRKYDALLTAQRLGQSAEADAFDVAAGVSEAKLRQRSQEELAIEAARQRDLQALRAKQEQTRIDQTARLQTATAEAVSQNYGAGTGISVVEARRTEQRALLEIERQAAQDSLNNTLNKTGKEAEIEREALRAQLARVEQQIRALKNIEPDFSISKLLLGDEDDGADGAKRRKLDQAISETVGAVTSALSDILAAEQQVAQQRAATATQQINELQASLNAQIELHKNGSASNIQGTLNEIQEQKEIRRQALEDQRKAAKEKVVLDTLTQASSIATSAANVIAGFSLIPIVGPALGIAAAALIIGAFAASKVRAFQAASSIGEGFFKGGYTGGAGGLHEERGPVHAREFVFDNEKTSVYRHSLFEPLHKGRPWEISWDAPEMQDILPDFDLPDRMRAERRLVVEHQMKISMGPLQAGISQLNDRLSAIEASNQRMADRPEVVGLGDGRYLERTENGSTHVVRVS